MKLVIGIFCILSGIVAFSTLRNAKPSKEVLNEPAMSTNFSHGTVPVLVELFTSEGCSSCPPADDLLSKLVKDEAIPGIEAIALGEPVDYWNNLGWRDQYSKSELSQRQRAYSTAFDLDSVYTPQMIIDGHEQFVGGDWNRARAAILKAASTQKGRVDIALANKANMDQQSPVLTFTVQVKDLPRRSPSDDSEVYFAITEDNLATQVARGENSGRFLRHSAVVRELTVLGNIAADNKTFATERSTSISPAWRRENLRAVAFVQEGRSRRVIAVGEVRLGAR